MFRPRIHRLLRSRLSRLACRLVSLALILAAAGLTAAQQDQEVTLGAETQTDEPYVFARVRAAENGLTVIREQGFEEQAARNDPVYVGDRVRAASGQRGELQLPDGAVIRLDHRSTARLFDLRDPTGRASDRTIVGLESGRMQALIPDPADGDGFRIDTPSASIYPLEYSEVRVDLEPGKTTRVTVERGRVEVAGEGGSVILRSGERTRVTAGSSPQRPWDVIVGLQDSFGLWIEAQQDGYRLERAPGEEYAALPDEVRPYYGELSRNGEWEWTDEYGWVWNPRVEDDWAPYDDGYWRDGPYGPAWVGIESWGWPVYRYGRWQWRVGLGWSWIPGSVFAGAHVYWYYGPSYVGWCPVGYYDTPVSISVGLSWGHPWFDHHPWVFAGYGDFYGWGHHRPHGYYGYDDFRHHRAGAARLVRPRLGRGVVSRRAVIRDRVRGGGRHRAGSAVRSRVLSSDAYDRAQQMANSRASGVRRVAALKEGRRDHRASFRERERRAGGAGEARVRRNERARTGRASRGALATARRGTGESGRRDGAASRLGESSATRRPVVRVRSAEQQRQIRDAERRIESRSKTTREVRRGREVPPTAPRRQVQRQATPRSSAESGQTRKGRATRSGTHKSPAAKDGASVRRFFGRVGSSGRSERAEGSTRGRSTDTKADRATAPRRTRSAPSRAEASGRARSTSRTRGPSKAPTASKPRNGEKPSSASRGRAPARRSPSTSRSRTPSRKSPSASKGSSPRRSPSATRGSSSRRSPSATRGSSSRKSPSASRGRSSRKSPSASRSRSSGKSSSASRGRSGSRGGKSSSGKASRGRSRRR